MSHTLLKSLMGLALLGTLSSANAYINDMKVCSYSAPHKAGANESVNLFASVSALRSETGQVPISMYYSRFPQLNTSDPVTKLLASGSQTVFQPGPFCSSGQNYTANIPADSNGLGCFTPGSNAYIIFKTPDDQKSSLLTLEGEYPELTSVTPQAAQPGMPVVIKGSGFTNANTAVYFGGVEAARAVLSSTEIYAIVPEGVSGTGVSVKHFGPGYEYCVPPISTASFTVQPKSCDSAATNTGYGNISYLAVPDNLNAYNVVGTASCANYTDNLRRVKESVAGGAQITIPFQLGTCGQTEYQKLLKLYVDWDQSSTFNGANELVLVVPTINANTLYNINLSVPASATEGFAKARLIMALYYNGQVDSHQDVTACGNYPFGETMDFTINIQKNAAGQLVAEIEDIDALQAAIESAEQKTDLSISSQKGKTLPILDQFSLEEQKQSHPVTEKVNKGNLEFTYPAYGPERP